MDVFFDWRWWHIRSYNTIWGKVSTDIKKEFDSHPVYNTEFLETKTKSHDDEGTNCYDKSIPKLESSHTCLVLISLHYALKKDDSNYPRVFLEECKYTGKNVIRHIYDNLSDFFSSSDEYDEEWIRISKACLSKNIVHYFSNWKRTEQSMLYF